MKLIQLVGKFSRFKYAIVDDDDFDYSSYIPDVPQKKKLSKYMGVTKTEKTWRMSIQHNHERYVKNGFLTEVDAAKAYDDYLRKNQINRPFNFPT